MLPGGLYSPARKGTMITPDSSYDWRSFGKHVTDAARARSREDATEGRHRHMEPNLAVEFYSR